MVSRRTETGDGRQAETRDNQLSWRPAGLRAEAGAVRDSGGWENGRRDCSATPVESADTDGQGPGGGDGGDGRVGDSVVGARGDVREG